MPPQPDEHLGGHGLPDSARLAELLRELAELRLGLETDLTITAAALDEGDVSVASAVLGESSRHLAGSAARMGSEGLVPLRPPRRQRMLTSTGTSLAAACVAVFALLSGGQLGSPSASQLSSRVAIAEQTYDDLLNAVTSNSPDAFAIAEQLHASLEPLIRAASHDPVSARRALEILQREQQVLLRGLPAGAERLLVETHRLVTMLRSAAPDVVPQSAMRRPQVLVPVPTPSVLPSSPARPSASPRPTARPTPTPTPSAKPTSSHSTRPVPPGPRPTGSPSPRGSHEPLPFPEAAGD